MNKVDAHRYLSMAQSFWASAYQLQLGPVQGERTPFYMLACHAIELSLKAVLLAQGARHEQIMMIGHDLERCFAEAVERGLGPCPSDVQRNVASLGYAHSVQGFRYPITWDFDVPDPETTMTTATLLLRLVQHRVAALRTPA